MPGKRPEGWREFLDPGAPPRRRPAMFAIDTDYDPIALSGQLLAELGLDARAVREALVDDRARRCPDREVPTGGSWREAGEG